jgi:hypothetical protein
MTRLSATELEGRSLPSIAHRLNAEGVPYPMKVTKRGPIRKGWGGCDDSLHPAKRALHSGELGIRISKIRARMSRSATPQGARKTRIAARAALSNQPIKARQSRSRLD